MEMMMAGVEGLLTPLSLLLLVVGVIWGIIVGAIPGLSMLVGITLVLPFTFLMEPTQGLLLIVATAAGANYGNGLIAVLIGVPGTPPAVITVMEGYPLYMKGDGGDALYLNLVSSVFGQLLGGLGFIGLIIPLSAFAVNFLAPEVFALAVLGLLAVASLTEGDFLKGIGSVLLGAAIATIGTDPVSAFPRFWFEVRALHGGLSIIPVVIGLLGLGELFFKLHKREFSRDAISTANRAAGFTKLIMPVRSLRPYTFMAILGSVIAFFVGVIPGIGATAACFLVYQQSKIFAKKPALFGSGSKEALVAQNAADNSVVGGGLVPTLGLGIPGSATMAVLLGALVIHGVQPGPLILRDRPELVGSVAIGLLAAGLILFPIGLAACYAGSKLTSVWPPGIPIVGIALILLGAFTVRGWWFDVGAIVVFGVVGYLMRVFRVPVAAAAIGFILGDVIEQSFRRGLMITRGDVGEFFTRPYTATILAIGFVLFSYGVVSSFRASREMPLESLTATGAAESSDDDT